MSRTGRSRLWWPVFASAEAAIGFVGYRENLRQPDLIDIPVFTGLLTSQGVSRQALIWLLLILPNILAMGAAIWIYVGTRHRSFPLWFGLGLVGLYLYQGGVGRGLTEIWGNVGSVIDVLLLLGALTVFLLFPNGRFQPRWSRWIIVVFGAVLLSDIRLSQDLRRILATPGTEEGRLLGSVAVMATILSIVVAQAVRYRRHSSRLERLQTKWVLVGGLFSFIPAGIALALSVFSPVRSIVGWLVAVSAFAGFVIPIACAVAITKYRLYDLGRVVSRTVSYALVAGAVGFLYIGGVGAVRFIFPLSGSLAVAASTLAAVALVTPLHRRIRTAIDRRFNRARFDAEVESAAFSSRLQSALNIDDLLADIVEVLAKTLQPASAAVWMTASIRPNALGTNHLVEKSDIPPIG